MNTLWVCDLTGNAWKRLENMLLSSGIDPSGLVRPGYSSRRCLHKQNNSTSVCYIGLQGFKFFSRLVGRSDPWSKKWWVIFWNDAPKHSWHLGSILYLHTDTCMHISILTADYTVKPVLSHNSKKKTNYRVMQVKIIAECSKGSILQSFRPSFSYHLLLRSWFGLFFEWLLKTRFTKCTFCLWSSLTRCKMNIFIKVNFLHN